MALYDSSTPVCGLLKGDLFEVKDSVYILILLKPTGPSKSIVYNKSLRVFYRKLKGNCLKRLLCVF